ncbi:hypothetical protein [Halodesulfovibrio marinisediminis]|uniref:Lipoprotein n=1 Tax=Halodesulfovibrio marinisediminis DSM 17456 TaxID=1121457 RepID=A0A1N6EC52_9BACT|nr:hypothetical protein [Halodesulfovibrio marinisediminis]SIN80615.1 hypothetical protein SAMN02745161_0880 [Halodesulfovibrio marinisediminis DSM 17456]
MKRVFSFLVVMMFVVASVGCSKTMMSYHDQSFQAPEGSLTLKQVEKAIVTAGAKRGWVMKKKRNGLMIGTLNVRNHMVQVNVKYNTEAFSITYLNSVNMNYNAQRKTIHRSYNTWIINLRNDIQATIPLAVME